MKRNDLKGKKFGSLLVLDVEGVSKAGHVTWKCKCDCGVTVVRTGTSLIRSKFSSCGNPLNKYGNTCFPRPIGKDNCNWKGFGDISSSWFSNVILRAASGRKSRTSIVKKVDITIDYIWELFLYQNKKCALSGVDLFLPKNNSKSELKKANASIDRIDSSLGYVKGNVQWVTKTINIMKNTMSQEEFISVCNSVYLNNCEIK